MTYNPSTPQSTDLISTSQGQILDNFSQLNVQFGVDHTAFNTGAGNGDGHHKQVTFNVGLVADPVVAGTASVVYPKIDGAGKQQLWFENSTLVTQLTGFASTLGSNGSFTFQGGLVIKWGTFTSTTGFSNVAFPVAFPTNCYAVVATNLGGSNTIGINLVSNTQFQSKNSTGGSVSANYIAIGK